MKLDEIREMALTRGFNLSGRSRRDLIRQFQQAEGNFACFATSDDGLCDQFECLWRDDCLEVARRPTKPEAKTEALEAAQ